MKHRRIVALSIVTWLLPGVVLRGLAHLSEMLRAVAADESLVLLDVLVITPDVALVEHGVALEELALALAAAGVLEVDLLAHG